MQSVFLHLFLIFTALLFVPACASQPSLNSDYTLLSEQPLPDSLSETSGLFCEGEQFLTLNDSGNAPQLFRVSATGDTQFDPLPFRNKDWESITATDKAIYVADVGNNSGKRQDLAIYKIDRNDPSNVTTLAFSYADNVPAKNVGLSHDFDAEAVTIKDDKLVLFSKSWRSKIAKVYTLDPTIASQTLTVQKEIEGLPGMITGADFDEAQRKFIVVGYATSGFGLLKPFVAVLNEFYQQERVVSLQGFSQVEGVCSQNGNIWFTQEKSPFGVPKLVKIRLDRQG